MMRYKVTVSPQIYKIWTLDNLGSVKKVLKNFKLNQLLSENTNLVGGRKTFTEGILRSLKKFWEKFKTHMNIFSKQNLQSLNKKSYSVHKSQSLQLSMFKIKLTYFTDCFKNVPVRRRYAVVQLCCLGKVQSKWMV